MLIELMNYANKRSRFSIPDLDSFDTVIITVDVIYGDEWVRVDDCSGNEPEVFMSDIAMFDGGYDGSYVVYSRCGKHSKPDVDLIHDSGWLNRKDSYEFLYA